MAYVPRIFYGVIERLPRSTTVGANAPNPRLRAFICDIANVAWMCT